MRTIALLAPLGFVAALWTGVHAGKARTDSTPTRAFENGRRFLRTPPNSVAITPGPTTVVTGSITVTVTWCGYPESPQTYMDIDNRVIKVNGVDVTGDFDLQLDPAACGFTDPVGDEVLYTSTGDVTVDASTALPLPTPATPPIPSHSRRPNVRAVRCRRVVSRRRPLFLPAVPVRVPPSRIPPGVPPALAASFDYARSTMHLPHATRHGPKSPWYRHHPWV